MVQAVEYISICIKCGMDVSVSEPCLKDYSWNSGLDTSGRKGMPQCMLPVCRDAYLMTYSLIVAVDLDRTDHIVLL